MRDEFLPFSRPTMTEEDVNAIAKVLHSGWITTGPKSAEFEKKFGRYIGCSDAAATTSATAGMHIALKVLGIGPGDEVITPSMTWVSTVNLTVLAGATPVFADIEKDTLMVSRESIEKCITPKTKLIIPGLFHQTRLASVYHPPGY
jgi:UDP-4-amino-4-deoxy-L-arabinose-oxoglutarate aminotransferase